MKKIRVMLVFSVFLLSLINSPILEVNSSTSGTANRTATDQLTVVYPHSSDFANWVFDDFQTWYKAKTGNDITITSDQKDSTAAEEEVAGWNGTSPEADIIWGGGAFNFELLRNNPGLNLLEPYTVAEHANYSATFGGWNLYANASEANPSWYAAAISGFGFMYNTEYLTAHNLPKPTTWADLTDYKYYGDIVMADPSASGSTTATVNQLIQFMSTDNGKAQMTTSADTTEAWQYFAKLAGNVGQFTTSSSQVPTLVANGDFGIGIVIDYYSWEQSEAGKPVEFTYGGATTASPDPVAIIHNAPHLDQAKAFMDYITSTQGQSRVGKYRTPANFRATTPTDGPVKRAFFDNGTADLSGFPIITPYSASLDGALFGRARTLFKQWFVINTDKQTAAWNAIWSKDTSTRDAALATYTKLPTGFNGTIASLLGNDYHNATVTDNWASEGAANFDAAKSKAMEGYSTTGTTSDTNKSSQIPGFDAYYPFLVLLPLAIVEKRKLFRKNK
jgi:ABC-type Fe3+ transport system substrate-binding protein